PTRQPNLDRGNVFILSEYTKARLSANKYFLSADLKISPP
ncbi:MAG: hypothetical protein ACI9K9_000717, partial [Neolewinella sp.]